MHDAMKLALVPKQFISASRANRHSASMSGWPGLPSYRQMVAPGSRQPTRKFHIIQPVVVNQNIRLPSCRSRCRKPFFSCSRRMPPCPCTIGFGSPVVPEENRMYSGWSNGTGSKVSSWSKASSWSQSIASRRPSRSPCSSLSAEFRYGSTTVRSRVGISA